MRVHLLSEDVKFEDIEFRLTEDALVLGRSRRADVQIIHPQISRLHCEWQIVDGEVLLRDLGSTNQTILNGEPVHDAVLQPGDRLLLGDVVYVVEFSGEDHSHPSDSSEVLSHEARSHSSHPNSEMPTTRLAVNPLPHSG